MPDLGFLANQSPWLILAIALIAAAAYVVTRVSKRGAAEGQRSLDAVDNALEYLATSARTDRDEKEKAEADLVTVKADLEAAQRALAACEERAGEAVTRAKEL